LITQCVDGFDSEEEHQIKGRTFHEPVFATPSGKVIAHDVPLKPCRVLSERQLRLMTIRSEGQFNTVVYEEEDVYRNQTRRDIVLMNPEDITQMGFEENKSVLVRGDAGELRVTVRSFDVKRGNCAMYFPEANVLLSNKVDVESKTPLFKGATVELFSSIDA
jgi:anaerobic selenocysteine-containing dehydrogenase